MRNLPIAVALLAASAVYASDKALPGNLAPPPAPAVMRIGEVRELIEGRNLTEAFVVIQANPTNPTHIRVDNLPPGTVVGDGDRRYTLRKGGVYRCWCDSTGPKMEPVDGKFDDQAATEVRPSTPFRPSVQPVHSGVSTIGVTAAGAIPVVAGDRSHLCPSCGAGPWTVIRGFNPDGTHTHTCESCGKSFKH